MAGMVSEGTLYDIGYLDGISQCSQCRRRGCPIGAKQGDDYGWLSLKLSFGESACPSGDFQLISKRCFSMIPATVCSSRITVLYTHV